MVRVDSYYTLCKWLTLLLPVVFLPLRGASVNLWQLPMFADSFSVFSMLPEDYVGAILGL